MGLLALAAALAALALYLAWVRIPPNWAPWGAVQLEEQPSWFARLQLNGLEADPLACYAALDRSKLKYRALPDRPPVNGCGLTGGVQMVRSQVAYSSGFRATCGVTAALYWYERELDRLARKTFGSGIARIEHLGTYACRDIAGQGTARRSQHATANAIDIAGFRLADGTSISVLNDWGTDSARGRFLAAALGEGCRFFNTVLGPDYNKAHANHFHLDLGPARLCR